MKFALLTIGALSALAANLAAESRPTLDDLHGIRAAYDVSRHRIVELRDGGHSAWNPRQQWRTTFDDRGFVNTPTSGGWQWGLELRAAGIGSEVTPVSPTSRFSAEENRLVAHRSDSLAEWYVNGTDGLLQGWTIASRPTNSSADETRLRLEFGVRGDLTPTISGDRRSAEFLNENGSRIVTYGGLKAWDAEGRTLPVEFVAAGDGLGIVVDERDASYPITIDPLAQQAYLKASTNGPSDSFGFAVAISGNTAVVGAPEEDSNAANVNGNQNDDSLGNSGAAYVFVRTAGAWTQQAYLKASNPGNGDGFGSSVAISGETIVVGAPAEDSNATGVDGPDNNFAVGSGAAYVFTRVLGTTWIPDAYLKASNTDLGDSFGTSVAISGDTIIVGAPLEDSTATGVNGATGNAGADSGAAYVFFRELGAWAPQAYFKASNTGNDDRFGASVAISGDQAVVGAPREDGVANEAGAAYTFARTGVNWLPGADLKAPNAGADDEFGAAAAISGDLLIVGAPNEDSPATGVNGAQNDGSNNSGAAYVFARNGALWPFEAYLKSSFNTVGNEFGGSVSISGNVAIAGGQFEDTNSLGFNGDQTNNAASNSGAAWAFRRTGGTWAQFAYIKASNTGFNDRFGGAVAVSNETAIVGARQEGSNGSGVNGVNNNNLSPDSGAAYVFDLTPTVGSLLPTITVKGKKKITTSKARIVVRGTAAGSAGITRVEFKAGKGKFKSAKLSGGTNWTAKVRIKGSGRVVAKFRAVDNNNIKSGTARVKITRR